LVLVPGVWDQIETIDRLVTQLAATKAGEANGNGASGEHRARPTAVPLVVAGSFSEDTKPLRGLARCTHAYARMDVRTHKHTHI
jgi:hypothetical protein